MLLRLLCWLNLCVLCCMASAHRAHAAERTAFYYQSQVPSDLLTAYDQVVVEPDHVVNLDAFTGARARPVAYLSVGEVARAGKEAKHVQKAWVLADNGAWSSQVMDLEHEGYRAYLMQRFEALWAAGYHGFFLDTLDSYRLGAKGQRAERLERALCAIILEMKQRHPEARLLLNRGFEVLADVKAHVSGVVAESLFDRWDAARRRYTRVPEKDRAWLLAELRRARDEHGLPVTVIDYRPPAERREARETARKIHALGFEPWVTDAALGTIGIGSVEILPRRVLILTNDILTKDPKAAVASEPDALRFLAPVLEYLGYVPEHRAVPERWSELGLEQGYQGVITWFSSSVLPPGYAPWMREQLERGVRFAVFGVPGFDLAGPEAHALGISLVAPGSAAAARVLARDGLVGFEAEPTARPFDGPLFSLTKSSGTVVHLELEDSAGRKGVAIATTPWGGLASSHVFSVRGLAGERAWVLDPFAFLTRALALPLAPMPNVTTHNGRRLAMILVRPQGLGLLSGYGQPTGGTALGSWLSAHHRWPHSLAAAREVESEVTLDDRKAAEQLLGLSFFAPGELLPGTTSAQGRATLTRVSGMFAGAEPVGPIALDSAFLPNGGPQAYPYADVVGTLEYTDAPRRLKPILLDYHGFLVSSPGGRGALGSIYDWLDKRELFPLYVHEYAELTRAWRAQVVARELGGAFRYFGGERLSTVRLPPGLGLPNLQASAGAVSVRPASDGHYVSFLPGSERRLVLGAERLEAPHVVHTTGRVLRFELLPSGPSGLALGIRLEGHVPLALELGGLPAGARCELVFAGGRSQGVATEGGSLVLQLEERATGDARLQCRAAKGDG